MTTTTNHAEQQAKAQLESIKEMVAALQCDYDRLEELRDERIDLNSIIEDACTDHAAALADGAEDEIAETKSAMIDAKNALVEWDNENAEELKELEEAAGDCESEENARERIEEDALSVQVRSGWYSPGASNRDGEVEPEEFEILLCTGGPACRIRGELDQHCQPKHAYLQYQDWGTPWTELVTTGADHDAILAYCNCFYFGD